MYEQKVFENIELFERWDEDYYQPISRRYYDHAVKSMLKLLAAKPDDLILDAGCGPGVHSIRVAQAGCRVHAIDISATVLEEAERRAVAAGIGDRITFEQNDLTGLSFGDRSFDRVFSWGVVIHIPEIERALAELVRILKPGGRLALHVTNARAWDHALMRVARSLLRRPRPAFEQLPMGRGCWYDTRGGRLWVWHLDIDAVTRYLADLGLRRIDRIAGEFTEIQWRLRGVLRTMLQGFNLAWHRMGFPAGPSASNLLVFEKAKPQEQKSGIP